MPEGMTIWLIKNTKLTSKQIGEFCNLHEIEVKRIAKSDRAKYAFGNDPISLGILSKEEIHRCEMNSMESLKRANPAASICEAKPGDEERQSLIAVVRHIDRTPSVKALDQRIKYWEVTLVDNRNRPNKRYVALVPDHFASNITLNSMVMVELCGDVREQVWIVSDINLL